MRFQLYLNQLSASQVLSEKKDDATSLNCYGSCNPYNARRIDNINKPISTRRDLYEALKSWLIKKERFGYIIYDPHSSRLYEADAEATKNISYLKATSSFEEFLNIAESSIGYRTLLETMNSVCI